MPKRPTPSRPERPHHSVGQKRQDIAQIQRRITELEGFDPQKITKRFSDPSVIQIQTAIEATLAAVFGHGTVEYDRYKDAATLDNGPVILRTDLGGRGGHYDDRYEAIQYVTEGMAQALALLRQAIRSLEEEIEFATPPQFAEFAATAARQVSRKIFLVHGRDDAAKNEVALFIRAIGLEPIILHLRPNGGRHLLTKFTEESEGAGFAVVLMTPDDEGGLSGAENRRPRARQNVVFELGFFIGKLGPASVAALLKGDVEKPSDFDGIAYIAFDSDNRWKTDLARELHHAKVPFDPAKAFTS
jgi:predicted nucleotide-binding protein